MSSVESVVVARLRAARSWDSGRGSGIAPGFWSSHPLCGCEKCVYVLIVLVDAGGGVDAGDAGPRAGVVAVRVGGVVAGVSVVSRELAPWSRWGRAGSNLAAVHPFATRRNPVAWSRFGLSRRAQSSVRPRHRVWEPSKARARAVLRTKPLTPPPRAGRRGSGCARRAARSRRA